LVVAVIATSFTSCKSEEEKMAEKSFDHYEKYMDSVNTIVEAEASANWQAIEAGYNDRMSEADMVLINMKDQTNAEDRLERTKAKYTEFKNESGCKCFRTGKSKNGNSEYFFWWIYKAGADIDFTWVNKNNILKLNSDFYNEFDKN
jgi:G3E family GTPase